MTNAERFVQQFVTTWGDPTQFPGIYEPEAIITSPVVRRRVVAGELAEFVDRTKALLPDARLHVERWAAGGDFVLIEWRIGATLAGEPLEWAGMSRFTLRGSRAVEEAVHFDTLPLWERLDPTMRRPGLLETPLRGTSEVISENVAVLNRYDIEGLMDRMASGEDRLLERRHRGDARDARFPVTREGSTRKRLAGSLAMIGTKTESVHNRGCDIAQADRVALRFRSEGTFRVEFMGMAPTGERVSYTGLVMYRFARCQVVEIWMGWDPASLVRRIGGDLEARPRPLG